MEERRRHLREETNDLAYITGDGSSIRCTVVNLSLDGAALEVPDASAVRTQFKLMTVRDGALRDCRIVWLTKNRIGVQFLPSELAATD
jgi:PilZ domain-containing protein